VTREANDDPSDGWFPESVAAGYDGPGGANAPDVVDPAVDLLAELADGGPVLELAVGTGRIAAPLAGRGVRVSGIELSRAMAARIGDKPGGEQVDVFRNAAAHLRPGGVFLVEVGIPDLRRMPPGQDTVPFEVAPRGGGGSVGFDRYDVATQLFSSTHVTVTPDGGRFRSIPFRYAWPAEMDLMARIAGMRLKHRWADWDRSPFEHESTKQVSVWEKV